MASIQQIKSGYSQLGGGGIDKSSLIKSAITKRFNDAYSSVCSGDEIDKMVQDAINSGSSYLYQTVEAQVSKLSVAVSVIPVVAASLVSQFSSIPGAVTGTAAPAAAPMLLGVQTQAAILKVQIADTLETALSLGVDVPGLDSVISAISQILPISAA